MELETKRLILRNYKMTDLDDYYDYVSQEKVGPMCGWPRHTSKEQSKKRLEIEVKKPYQFCIVHKQDNKVIGSVEIMEMDSFYEGCDANTTRELGALLSEKYWGQGIMPEALRAVIDYAFDELGLETIVAGNFESNTQSGRAQDKIGLKPYGRVKDYTTDINGNRTDLIIRKVTKEEWKQQKKEMTL